MEEQKKCCCCKIEKNISEFGKNINGKNGISFDCKKCINNRAAEYRKTINGHLHELFNHAKKNAK